MNRREFLKMGASGAALAVAGCATTEGKSPANPAPVREGEIDADEPLAVGEPCLQNAAETTMCVCWRVSSLANGWVEYGKDPELGDAQIEGCEGPVGITGFDALCLRVRLQGLLPATKYYYRTVTTKIVYHDNYHRETKDTVKGAIHSFTTIGAAAKAHFCVISDTHEQWDQFAALTSKIRSLNPSVTVWNGDAANMNERVEQPVRIFLDPPKSTGYASDIPLLWNNGNHDFRGIWNRYLERFMMVRTPSERNSRDWALTRNWAVRLGEVAMVGLDTGEDKPDAHPQFCGLVRAEAYRVAQVAWLKDALERPEIKSAPYLVAFCHIPLSDPDPRENPGDVVGDGGGKYNTDYAHWQKPCRDLWMPHLEKAKVTLVVSSHRHRYRFDPADANRPWPQIVTGGCGTNRECGNYPTVVEGKVEGGRLKVTVHDVLLGTVAGTHAFGPRR